MRVATTPYARDFAHEPAVRTALADAGRFARNALLFAAAPFIGLAYVLAFPFVGFGALVWMGARAALARRGA